MELAIHKKPKPTYFVRRMPNNGFINSQACHPGRVIHNKIMNSGNKMDIGNQKAYRNE